MPLLASISFGCVHEVHLDSTPLDASLATPADDELDAQLERMYEAERLRMEREREEACMAACWVAGTCAYDSARDTCVATADGCAASQVCAQEGRCVLGSAPRRCVSPE